MGIVSGMEGKCIQCQREPIHRKHTILNGRRAKAAKKTTKTKKPKNEMNTKKNMITHKHRIQKSTLILFECWKKLLGQQRCCFFWSVLFLSIFVFFSRASSSLCMFFRILCERAYVSDILSAARHTLSI